MNPCNPHESGGDVALFLGTKHGGTSRCNRLTSATGTGEAGVLRGGAAGGGNLNLTDEFPGDT